ncbi:MAG TPA: hypothetical protein VFQ45_16180 [Longimicrobium sp.]|nr:hypothetical protein [Longimicrobium sp.]
MLRILDWLPLIWTIRVALLIVVGVSAALFVLFLARYFRWSSIKQLVMSDLPRIKSLGGEFAGTKGEVHFQEAQVLRAEGIEARLQFLEDRYEQLHRLQGRPNDEGRVGEGSR